jgi:hypothetical protein
MTESFAFPRPLMKKKKHRLNAGRRLAAKIRKTLDSVSPIELRTSKRELASLEGRSVACFLCRRPLTIKLSRKGRPYLQCLDCYQQTFVRGNRGIERLRKVVDQDGE